MLKQTVNKNNIHVPVGVSQVSQLVAMILLINDCYVMALVVITSRMNFVLYRNRNIVAFKRQTFDKTYSHPFLNKRSDHAFFSFSVFLRQGIVGGCPL